MGLELALAGVDADWVARDQVVLDGDLEDLPEAGDRLVDRLGRQRGFVDLASAVSVDLGDRDLRQPMPGEERQQVIAQLPLVVEHGVGCPLAAVSVEPLAGELVERWVGLDVDLTRRIRRAPDASSNVGQDVCNSSSACARFHPSSVVPSVWYRRSPYAVKRSAYDVPRRVRFSTTAPVGGLGISPAAVRGNGRRQAMGPGGGCRELCQSRPAAGYCVLVRSAAAQQAGAYRCVRAEASHPRWLEGRSDVPVPPARGTSDGPSAPYPCAGRRDRASACNTNHPAIRCVDL